MLTTFCLLVFGKWPHELGINPVLTILSLCLDTYIASKVMDISIAKVISMSLVYFVISAILIVIWHGYYEIIKCNTDLITLVISSYILYK